MVNFELGCGIDKDVMTRFDQVHLLVAIIFLRFSIL